MTSTFESMTCLYTNVDHHLNEIKRKGGDIRFIVPSKHVNGEVREYRIVWIQNADA